MRMGKVIVVRCPLCGWAKHVKPGTPLGEYFRGDPDGAGAGPGAG